ncbi:MAG TPA: TRAP transporter substrate-binding protein [Thermopetrobacter sp.]|nr:TRAP transporter substrate-binding protein [Thermopetrobacter sp.]
MTITRRKLLTASAAASAALAAPALATEKTVTLRMVTSWPKNMPGPGVSAELLAEDITRLSGGTLNVKVHAAGELVAPLAVFDAVQNGAAEMAHTASLFWGGKMPAAALFTAGPFGLSPVEHRAWLEEGGGQKLWDDLYADFGIKPLMCGNTGPGMGGWFRKPVTSVDDMKGLKMRMPGLGGAIIRRMGATPVTLPPGEIQPALQSGAIDATEFLGPSTDMAMGFYKVAKFYHYPAFHEPNGAGELLVSRKVWDGLSADQRRAITIASSAEAARSLAGHAWRNAAALKTLQQKGVKVLPYPADVLKTARAATAGVLADLAKKDPMSEKIVASWLAARAHLGQWSDISLRAFFAARTA